MGFGLRNSERALPSPKARSLYQPELPPCLQLKACDHSKTIRYALFPDIFLLLATVRVEFGDATTAADPSWWGIVFCGRQSPGGHNVIWDFLRLSRFIILIAFYLDFWVVLKVLFAQKTLQITDDVLATYKNQEQVSSGLSFLMCECDKNLYPYFYRFVGVPVTLNGDLKNQFVETNVNSQLISNVCTDALSAEKLRQNLHFFDITKQVCDAVQARAEQDKYHGVILLPEGLIESIPEVYALLKEIHVLLREGVSADNISSQLSPWASALFEFLPPFIRRELLLYPESDDSAQLSQKEGTYKGKEIQCYLSFLWLSSSGIIADQNLIVTMPMVLRQNAGKFLMDDVYRNPGPLQFDGPGADTKAVSLCVEDQDYMGRIKQLQEYLEKVRTIVKPGCSQDVLKAALSAMSSVTEILSVLSSSGNAPF
nr:Pyrophosphate--fructose 6-phosphate 1-phosphotransferase subunit alpha [Ipomoea batatas]